MVVRVYVAGPYTQGNQGSNVRDAVSAGEELLNAGLYPYVPHLNHLWHLIFPHKYEEWMDLDLTWLRKCDILLKLPGESPGADLEEETARGLNMPIFYSIDAVLGYYREHYCFD